MSDDPHAGIGGEDTFDACRSFGCAIRDDDLAGNEYTRRGAYLRLRFKFDETVLP